MAEAQAPGPSGQEPVLVTTSRPERPRLAVVHDTDGPKVRLGLAWFAAIVGAALLARPLLALVLAVAAGLAADQVARLRWGVLVPTGTKVDGRLALLLLSPTRLPAALAAAALPLAALSGPDMLAAGLAATVVVVLVHRLFTPTGGSPLQEVAITVTAGVALGLAAAAPVLIDGLGTHVVVVVLVLVAAYDVGDFLVGTGASTTWEGPVAGAAAAAVVGFGASVVALPPLDERSTLLLTAVVCVFAPLGPPAASLLTGDGRRSAGFVRRLDSLVVLGPVLAWVAAATLGGH